MKAICVSIFLFSCSIGYSQIENNKTLGVWNFNTAIGFSTLEVQNLLKTNATIFEGGLQKEFFVSNKFYLLAGVGLQKINFEYLNDSNLQIFSTNNFAILPVSLGYQEKVNNTSFFVEGGVYGSYLYYSKNENIRTKFEDTKKGLGGNLGLQSTIGLKQKINDLFSFNLGILFKGDLLHFYNDSDYKIKELYAVQIGLSLLK